MERTTSKIEKRRPHDPAPTWDRAAYPAAEAARLVGLTPTRVRRWLKGYDYRYHEEVRRRGPVVKRSHHGPPTYASFLDLIDLLFVKGFLDRGLSLQRVRKALEEAASILGTTHFARKSFFTDGHNVYLKVKDAGDDILELLSGGQWVIAPVIQKLAAQIDFDSPSGLARRWYPLGTDVPVVLDPATSFGRPSIEGTGIATANVYDFYVAEDEDEDKTASWYGLPPQAVEAAVRFERRLAA